MLLIEELIKMQSKKVNSKVLFLAQSALLAAVLCILSPIAIPIGPIPITLCVFAVMLTGVLLDWKRACAAVAVYILLGLIGLPVFSGGKSGFGVLVGPTGGYIWSFLFMAVIIALVGGRARERYLHEAGFALIGCVASLVICYLLGTFQFTLVADCDWSYALSVCVYPFIPFDLAKGVCASLLGVQIRRRLRAAGLV